MENIRIVLVEDNSGVREGVRRVLELEPDMKVVAQASTADEAITQVGTFAPDIILMDFRLPGMDGIELTRRLTKEKPKPKILIFTLYERYLADAMEAGAVGYLRKDLQRTELVQAIRAAHKGRAPS